MITIASGGLCPSNSGPCFPNMAGNRGCNFAIVRELLAAGIEIVHKDLLDREVPAMVSGRLGAFTFERAWYYWVVGGPVPLDVARELYAHADGHNDVRVAGHCGCPPPEEPWVHYYDADGNRLYSDPDGKRAAEHAAFIAAHPEWADGDMSRYVLNAAAVATRAVIESYHIDTQAGLCLFADTIRAHGLHEGA